MLVSKKVEKFDWDHGNVGKNKKHEVDDKEAEESFFDKDKVVLKDKLHSGAEERFILLGKTRKGRLLYTVFTIRGKKVRIISARDTNKKGVKLYEKAT